MPTQAFKYAQDWVDVQKTGTDNSKSCYEIALHRMFCLQTMSHLAMGEILMFTIQKTLL